MSLFPKLRTHLLGMLMVALVTSPVFGSPNIILVPEDAPTIAQAVDLCQPGDVIDVAPGTYVENVTVGLSLTIRGRAGAPSTIWSAEGGPFCISLGPNVGQLTVQDLTLRDAIGHDFESGYVIVGFLDVGYPDLVVERCRIIGGGYGGIIWYGRDVQFLHSEFSEIGGSSTAGIEIYSNSVQVEDCLFHDFIGFVALGVQRGFTSVRRCVFRDMPWSTLALGANGGALVEDCLFHDVSQAIGQYWNPVGPRILRNVVGGYVIRGSTFARIDWLFAASSDVTLKTFEYNIVTGGGGVFIPSYWEPTTIACNNVWGNTTNWSGISDPTGLNGNISVPPCYCNSAEDDFTLVENSSCLPENNSCGVRIGAFGVGCEVTSIDETSWGRIKTFYR